MCAWWSILNAVCILIIAYLTRTSKNVWKNYYSYKIKLLLLRFSWRCFCRFSNHFTIYISWECIPCIIIVVGKTLNNLVAVFIWELLLGQILWIVSSLLQIFLTWIWFIWYLSSDDNLKTYKYWIIFFCNLLYRIARRVFICCDSSVTSLTRLRQGHTGLRWYVNTYVSY